MPSVYYPRILGENIVQSKFAPAFILEARILDVNIDRYTLTVSPQFVRNPQSDIPFSVPYQHFTNGEGIYFMPEVGSLCWLCYTSQGGKPVVLGWSSAMTEDGSFKANKQNLNPGDIYLGTRDENFLILRRGGVVQIGGGPLNQRIFLPVNNTIKDFCENYGLHTLGGDLEWTVRRTEETTDGHRPSSLRVAARQFADDAGPIAEMEIGSHDGDDTSIVSLLIRDSGDPSAAKKIEVYLRKTGDVEWVVQGNVSWDVAGTYSVHAKGDASISSDGNATVFAQQLASVIGENGVAIDGKAGNVDITGKTVTMKPTAFVGGSSAGDPVARSVPLMLWLATHTHRVIAPGVDTLPPTTPPPGDIVSKTLFAK